MNNDKAFAIYAFTLTGAVFSLFAILMATGVAGAPGLAFGVEHASLGLLIRSGYKSLDGGNPIVDFLHYTGWMTTEENALPANAIPTAA